MSSGKVKRVLQRHQTDLVKLERAHITRQEGYLKGVAKRYKASTTPSFQAGDKVFAAARAWRKEVQATYSDLKALPAGATNRALAMQSYANLDNALYWTILSLKHDEKDLPGQLAKATSFFKKHRTLQSQLTKALG